MTGAGGDLCASPHCGDLALPGSDRCAGCTADLQAERAAFERMAALLTAAHEARVEAQEQTT